MGIVLKLIKYKGKYYSKGDEIKVDKEDVKNLVSKGFIEHEEIEEVEEIDYVNLTIADIKKILDEKEIEYNDRAKKDDLIALLEGGNID